MPALIDLTVHRFTRLVVIGRAKSTDKRTRWETICDCGNKQVIRGDSLLSNRTTSCGCLNREIITKHGLHDSRIYHCWESMISRCTRVGDSQYHRYGGRGIQVCESWRKFDNFYADMKDTYQDHLTLDREDNEKGYSPLNCRWATRKEQANNRSPRFPRYYGERLDDV